jgi:hypothetical protein
VQLPHLSQWQPAACRHRPTYGPFVRLSASANAWADSTPRRKGGD